MPDWDEDSPRLRRNLRAALASAAAGARRRDSIDLDVLRAWHRRTMTGLAVPNSAWVGRFRGEPGLQGVEVRIGKHRGLPAARVLAELDRFAIELQRRVDELDASSPTADELTASGLQTVLELTAWAHSQWVRIHPFANGNGRTARILANALFMRYGLPPAIALRPRPMADYVHAARQAMQGHWQAMVPVLSAMLTEALGAR